MLRAAIIIWAVAVGGCFVYAAVCGLRTFRRVRRTVRKRLKGAAKRAPFRSSGGRIRTCDLRVMSPTSYRAAPPRVIKYKARNLVKQVFH